MPIEVKDFIGPANDYSGLYQLGSDMFKNRQFNAIEADKKAAAAQKLAQDKAGKQASMAKFLVDYTNPKDHLSGTPTDPVIVKGLNDALQYGEKLIAQNKDLTIDQLLGQLSPIVGKISQYAQAAKVVNTSVNERLKEIPEGQGYNKMKLAEAAKKQAFFNLDGTPKDPSEVSSDIDYVSEAVKNNPDQVTDNKGIDEWLKNQSRLGNSTDVIHYNAKGGRERKKVKTTAYNWAVPETDASGVNNGKFVPEYDIAHDGGQTITHDFVDKDGKKINAPVRMVTDRLFNSIMMNSPGTGDFVRGQVMKAIKSGEYKDANGEPITIDSPQANALGKVILYDELKTRGLGGMEDIVDTKPAQIKNITNIRVGNKDVPVVDVYTPLKALTDEHFENQKNYTPIQSQADPNKLIYGAVPASSLDEQQQEAVLKAAQKADKEIKAIDDIYLKKASDGSVGIVRAATDKLITSLTQIGTNVPANTGVKSKLKAIEQAQGKSKKPSKDPLGLF